MPNYRQKKGKKNNKNRNKNNNNNNNNNNNQKNQKNSTNQNKSNRIEQPEKEVVGGALQQVGNVSSESTGIVYAAVVDVHCQIHPDIKNYSDEDKHDNTTPTTSCSTQSSNEHAADDIVFNKNDDAENVVKNLETIDEDNANANMGSKNSKELHNEPDNDNLNNVDADVVDVERNELNSHAAKTQTQQVKVVIHRIVPESKPPSPPPPTIKQAAKVIIHPIAIEEEPDDVKEDSEVQSPNDDVDNNEKTTVQIQEILSDEEAKAKLTPEYDELKLKRAQKRAALETHFLPQLLSPRYLDSISEENSSDQSDARSDCSDRVGGASLRGTTSSSIDTEPQQCEVKAKRANARFPRSNLDFSKKHKYGNTPNSTLPLVPGTISEEPLAMMVEAKLIEQSPEQSCTIISTLQLETQCDDAEVIYIQSSTSSSTSDLMELEEERETVDLDTDVNMIITKPTIDDDVRETTPVNQTSTAARVTENLPEFAQLENNNHTILVENNADEQIVESKQAEALKIIENDENDTANNNNDEEQLSQSSSTIVDTTPPLSSASSFVHEPSITSTIFDESLEVVEKTADDLQSLKNVDSSTVCAISIQPMTDSSIIDATSVEDSAVAFARLENTCREIMDNVRGIIVQENANSNRKRESVNSSSTNSLVSNQTEILNDNYDVSRMMNGKVKSPSPPPIPPPPRQFEPHTKKTVTIVEPQPPPPLPMQRQESAESHCSSSTNHSQCTAINLGALSPQRDYDVSSPTIISDNNNIDNTVRSQSITTVCDTENGDAESIEKLRLLCTKKLASLPYGEQVLEELANVAQNIGESRASKALHNVVDNCQKINDKIIVPVELDSKTLRKSSSSPPPIPPPPVPTKSSETAAKANNVNTRTIPIYYEHDVSVRNANSKEQKTPFSMNGDHIDNANDSSAIATSSFENSTRQETKLEERIQEKYQQTITKSCDSSSNKSSGKLTEMQSVESELGRMFPSMGSSNMFDNAHKRFSNIEHMTTPAVHEFKTQPKRYSNIETHSFEAGNGETIYNYEQDVVDAVANNQKLPAKIHDIKIEKSADDAGLDVAESIRSAIKLGEQLSNDKNKNVQMSNGDKHKNYEEFRQNAKDEAQPSTIHQDKLFKEFDELSQKLHHELESGRVAREQREKSASLFDINRIHMKDRFDELKRLRHEHMLELEREIERSSKSRQLKREMSYDHTQQQQQQHKEHEIPIKLESGLTGPPKNQYNATVTGFEHDSNSPFRRTESLYNLANDKPISPYPRPRTSSSTYDYAQTMSDDWSQYASDLGSSENITRPFAREMQICYQRQQQQQQQQQPRTIRAPRLTASHNDLSYAPPTFDTYNAYNVRRTQAPMLAQTQQQTARPAHHTSCYSVLERDPNPTYISTTSRRGVSPAPQQTQQQQQYQQHRQQSQMRRASLPREIQEQQLKYITSKEEELRMEFERLQNERRRLLEELHNEKQAESQAAAAAAPAPVSPRPMRDFQRLSQRLPTLSEDEVFRQQMAEEWLSKVAEREERRLQKIIKVSKIHEEQNLAKHLTQEQRDISQEFLNRVKERRHKLHMPADSDWESGAESQPQRETGQTSESEDNMPPVKIVSGKSTTDLNHLPRHLKEFAKFSDQHTENLADGAQRFIYKEEEKQLDATPHSSSSAEKKATMVKTVRISRQPPQLLTPGQGEFKSSTTNLENASNDKNTNCSLTTNTNAHSSNIDTNNNKIEKETETSSGIGAGSVLSTALVIGLGILGAWTRLT